MVFFEGLSGVENVDMLEIHVDHALRYVTDGSYPVRRGCGVVLDDYTALFWVHGAAAALNPRLNYFQGKTADPRASRHKETCWSNPVKRSSR